MDKETLAAFGGMQQNLFFRFAATFVKPRRVEAGNG